jgi:hypothetical protein
MVPPSVTLRAAVRHGVAVVVMCLTVIASARLGAQNEDVVVVDSMGRIDPIGTRPLAGAIKEFTRRCQCSVTYEDVKWERDQVVVSPSGRRADGSPMLVPRAIPFRFTVSRNLAQMNSTEIAQSLGSLLNEFGYSQNPGQFKVVRGQTALHVLPVRSSILEKAVNVTANDVQAAVAVEMVIDELLRVSGEKVGVWNEPWNLMIRRQVRVTASNEPAYQVLSRILTAVDGRLSWLLFYDVNINRYSLEIYRPQ